MIYPLALAVQQQQPLSTFSTTLAQVGIYSSAPKPPQEPRFEFLSERQIGTFSLPEPIPARWLADIEQKIKNSVRAQEDAEPSDFETLTSDVAFAAIQFFQTVSDVLPSEPYLYSSGRGDLIGEFRGPRGSLTTIVGARKLWLFSNVNGEMTKEQWDLSNKNAIRSSLQRTAGMFDTNGAVGA